MIKPFKKQDVLVTDFILQHEHNVVNINNDLVRTDICTSSLYQFGHEISSSAVFYTTDIVQWTKTQDNNPINTTDLNEYTGDNPDKPHETELISYKRQVYNTVQQMYYNTYNNSYNIFGINGYDTSKVIFDLGSDFLLVNFNIYQMGDSIQPNSVKLYNWSGDIIAYVYDDGYHNLYLSGSYFINKYIKSSDAYNIKIYGEYGLGKYYKNKVDSECEFTMCERDNLTLTVRPKNIKVCAGTNKEVFYNEYISKGVKERLDISGLEGNDGGAVGYCFNGDFVEIRKNGVLFDRSGSFELGEKYTLSICEYAPYDLCLVGQEQCTCNKNTYDLIKETGSLEVIKCNSIYITPIIPPGTTYCSADSPYNPGNLESFKTWISTNIRADVYGLLANDTGSFINNIEVEYFSGWNSGSSNTYVIVKPTEFQLSPENENTYTNIYYYTGKIKLSRCIEPEVLTIKCFDLIGCDNITREELNIILYTKLNDSTSVEFTGLFGNDTGSFTEENDLVSVMIPGWTPNMQPYLTTQIYLPTWIPKDDTNDYGYPQINYITGSYTVKNCSNPIDIGLSLNISQSVICNTASKQEFNDIFDTISISYSTQNGNPLPNGDSISVSYSALDIYPYDWIPFYMQVGSEIYAYAMGVQVTENVDNLNAYNITNINSIAPITASVVECRGTATVTISFKNANDLTFCSGSTSQQYNSFLQNLSLNTDGLLEGDELTFLDTPSGTGWSLPISVGQTFNVYPPAVEFSQTNKYVYELITQSAQVEIIDCTITHPLFISIDDVFVCQYGTLPDLSNYIKIYGLIGNDTGSIVVSASNFDSSASAGTMFSSSFISWTPNENNENTYTLSNITDGKITIKRCVYTASIVASAEPFCPATGPTIDISTSFSPGAPGYFNIITQSEAYVFGDPDWKYNTEYNIYPGRYEIESGDNIILIESSSLPVRTKLATLCNSERLTATITVTATANEFCPFTGVDPEEASNTQPLFIYNPVDSGPASVITSVQPYIKNYIPEKYDTSYLIFPGMYTFSRDGYQYNVIYRDGNVRTKSKNECGVSESLDVNVQVDIIVDSGEVCPDGKDSYNGTYQIEMTSSPVIANIEDYGQCNGTLTINCPENATYGDVCDIIYEGSCSFENTDKYIFHVTQSITNGTLRIKTYEECNPPEIINVVFTPDCNGTITRTGNIKPEDVAHNGTIYFTSNDTCSFDSESGSIYVCVLGSWVEKNGSGNYSYNVTENCICCSVIGPIPPPPPPPPPPPVEDCIPVTVTVGDYEISCEDTDSIDFSQVPVTISGLEYGDQLYYRLAPGSDLTTICVSYAAIVYNNTDNTQRCYTIDTSSCGEIIIDDSCFYDNTKVSVGTFFGLRGTNGTYVDSGSVSTICDCLTTMSFNRPYRINGTMKFPIVLITHEKMVGDDCVTHDPSIIINELNLPGLICAAGINWCNISNSECPDVNKHVYSECEVIYNNNTYNLYKYMEDYTESLYISHLPFTSGINITPSIVDYTYIDINSSKISLESETDLQYDLNTNLTKLQTTCSTMITVLESSRSYYDEICTSINSTLTPIYIDCVVKHTMSDYELPSTSAITESCVHRIRLKLIPELRHIHYDNCTTFECKDNNSLTPVVGITASFSVPEYPCVENGKYNTLIHNDVYNNIALSSDYNVSTEELLTAGIIPYGYLIKYGIVICENNSSKCKTAGGGENGCGDYAVGSILPCYDFTGNYGTTRCISTATSTCGTYCDSFTQIDTDPIKFY